MTHTLRTNIIMDIGLGMCRTGDRNWTVSFSWSTNLDVCQKQEVDVTAGCWSLGFERSNEKEHIIAIALSTDEGREALAKAMVEPLRTSLQYNGVL